MSLFKRKLPMAMFRVLISIPALLLLAVSFWKFPPAMPSVGIGLLMFGFTIAISSILKKHRTAYRQGKLTRAAFLRNVLVEIFGILFAVALAGLLGRYIAEILTGQIKNDLMQLIAGIAIGLLAGIGVGILVRQAWGRFVKIPSEG